MMKKQFVKIYEEAFREHWALPAVTNYETGTSHSIANFAQGIAKIHLLLDHLHIEKGDKVTLIANDSAEWCIIWMGVVTYGAVVVPILPDFHDDDIRNIISHSDSKLVFVGREHIKCLSLDEMPEVMATFGVETMAPLPELTRSELAASVSAEKLFAEHYPLGFRREDIIYPEISNEEIALINYTSGTTGFSKGVIITHNNLAANVLFGLDEELMKPNDNLLCFLPNAHAYSCTFNFLLPLASGTHVFIFGAKPTPTKLISALKSVKPRIVLSVPLVLEKMYKSVILPAISKGPAKLMVKIPGLRNVVYKKIKDKLMEAFGGNLFEVIVGGAALNEEVQALLTKINFPVVVGYGMTECAPLISYTGIHKKYMPGSCGRPLDSVEEVRIADAKEINGEMIGEIQVRGENVCKGYYKQEQLTLELFTADGWMRTGDLGTMDKHRNIFIKGRSKSMLLGPNGQNIYPEEIEAKIVMLPYMLEAVVIQRADHRIVGVVVPDFAALQRDGITTDEQVEKKMTENREELNRMLPAYSRVNAFEIRREEFEKTPKQSIKRYLVK